ncbi:hypothetical protein [Micromonospora sp. WMMD708]
MTDTSAHPYDEVSIDQQAALRTAVAFMAERGRVRHLLNDLHVPASR